MAQTTHCTCACGAHQRYHSMWCTHCTMAYVHACMHDCSWKCSSAGMRMHACMHAVLAAQVSVLNSAASTKLCASAFPCMHDAHQPFSEMPCTCATWHAWTSHVNPCSVVLRAPVNACSAHLSVEAPLAIQELAGHGALACTCSPTLARHAAATRCCSVQPDHGRPVWKAFKRV